MDGRRRKMPLFISSNWLAVFGSKPFCGPRVAKAPSRLVGINSWGSGFVNALSEIVIFPPLSLAIAFIH
jgi:hypothetical protein